MELSASPSSVRRRGGKQGCQKQLERRRGLPGGGRRGDKGGQRRGGQAQAQQGQQAVRGGRRRRGGSAKEQASEVEERRGRAGEVCRVRKKEGEKERGTRYTEGEENNKMASVYRQHGDIAEGGSLFW